MEKITEHGIEHLACTRRIRRPALSHVRLKELL